MKQTLRSLALVFIPLVIGCLLQTTTEVQEQRPSKETDSEISALRDPGSNSTNLRYWQRKTRDDPESADAQYQLGAIYLDMFSKSTEARACFRKALILRPGMTQAHIGLGWAWLDLNSLRSHIGSLVLYREDIDGARNAIESFQVAVALEPELFEPYLGLGYALGILGRDDESPVALQQAARLAPESASVRLQLASAYFACGRDDEGLTEWLEAITLDRKNTSPTACYFQGTVSRLGIRNLAFEYEKLGMEYETLGRIEQAIDAYQTALDLDGVSNRRPSVRYRKHYNLGRAFVKAGRDDLARAEYENMIKLGRTSNLDSREDFDRLVEDLLSLLGERGVERF